jgi:hypothetical protein
MGVSFSSVVGTQGSTSKETTDSPLFSVRTQRSLQKSSAVFVQSQYLGKGVTSNLFLTTRPSLASAIDRTVKLLEKNPVFFVRFIKTITSNPRVISLLEENGISMTEFKTELNRMKNDPSVFLDEMRNAGPRIAAEKYNTPLPLSLNTSNPIGCVITAIALIPVVLVISLIVVLFTLRIIQCLNIEEIMNQIFDQIMQELFPAGYNI